jgi:hypothetical protein
VPLQVDLVEFGDVFAQLGVEQLAGEGKRLWEGKELGIGPLESAIVEHSADGPDHALLRLA